jgi:hypothetical protein
VRIQPTKDENFSKKEFDLDNHEKSSFLKKCWTLGLIDFGET